MRRPQLALPASCPGCGRPLGYDTDEVAEGIDEDGRPFEYPITLVGKPESHRDGCEVVAVSVELREPE